MSRSGLSHKIDPSDALVATIEAPRPEFDCRARRALRAASRFSRLRHIHGILRISECAPRAPRAGPRHIYGGHSERDAGSRETTWVGAGHAHPTRPVAVDGRAGLLGLDVEPEEGVPVEQHGSQPMPPRWTQPMDSRSGRAFLQLCSIRMGLDARSYLWTQHLREYLLPELYEANAHYCANATVPGTELSDLAQ